MSDTISALIWPPSTISTTSIVSSSVTRTPSTNSDFLPSRASSWPICGPPPCTITGRSPMKRSRVTSVANEALSASFSIAAPPYLITTVLSKNARM